jgi:hypothetical protein
MANSLVSDITHFYEASTRAENDVTNRRRERSILILNDPQHAFFSDPVYGDKWTTLLEGLRSFIKEILVLRGLSTDYKRFHLDPRGGLKQHFDILILVYTEDNQVLSIIDFEFKFNSMPQFTNLFDKDAYIRPTLAEFWYDQGWVDRMCEPYTDLLRFNKPSREEYLKGANKMMTKNFPDSFFKQFYLFDHSDDSNLSVTLKARRVDAVHQGIRAYLEAYGSSFQVEKLSAKLAEDQMGKLYGIWNPDAKTFKVLEYSKEEMAPTSFLRIQRGDTIVLKAGPSEMHLLLRWKNTLGITTPAWQISLHRA